MVGTVLRLLIIASVLSPLSVHANATADTTAPTVPTGFVASALSSSQIQLSWNASTDPDNTSSQLIYHVRRNGVVIAATTAGATTWTDSGLAPSTIYSYTVRASDPYGNYSALTAPVSTQTGTHDTTAPTVPTGFVASALSSSQIQLSWNASTDPDNTSSQLIYHVRRNGVVIAATTAGATTWTDSGLAPSTIYSYTVRASDPYGNYSALTAPVSTQTGTHDTTAPTVPTGFVASALSSSQIQLSWNASTDPDNTSSQLIYHVRRNGVVIAATTAGATTWTDSGLAPSTIYSYTVRASDPYGNYSALTAPVSTQTGTHDTTAPTLTTGFVASALSSSQIQLSWNASTDPDNTSSQLIYHVRRNGVVIAATTAGATTWTDSGLAPSTIYSYTVRASDPYGNYSALTAPVSTQTGTHDTTAPTVPTGFVASALSFSQIQLSWNASTDPDNTSSQLIYHVRRNGVVIAATTAGATTWTDSGLAPSTIYSYMVRASDPYGNYSALTAPVSTQTGTQNTQAPTVSITSPTNNQPISGTTTIAANAADNVGVVGVQFQVDGGNLGAEVTAAPYAATWMSSQTSNGSHLLTAVARNAAGNKTTSSAVPVSVTNTSLRPYSTSFPLTENPVSLGGIWINGGSTGLDWVNSRTTPGLAFGTVVSGAPPYNDSTAVLAGTWASNQMAQATVYTVNQTHAIYEEAELDR